MPVLYRFVRRSGRALYAWVRSDRLTLPGAVP